MISCPWSTTTRDDGIEFAECVEEYCAMWGKFMGVDTFGNDMWDYGCTVGRTVMVDD